jgi:hypothetical protein
MSMKSPGRTVYKTMQGKEIDLEKLRKKNELTLAVGNVRVNARGDELGPGGKIVKKREDAVKEYYTTHADSVPHSEPTVSVPGAKFAEQKDLIDKKFQKPLKKKSVTNKVQK